MPKKRRVRLPRYQETRPGAAVYLVYAYGSSLKRISSSVPAEDRLYVDVINYLSSEDLAKKRTGTLVARTETADRCIVPFWHQKTTRDDSHDCQIIYTSKFGTRFFCHDGKPLFLRLRFAKPSGPQNSRKPDANEELDFGSRAFWDTTIVKPQRPLSTVYLDEGEKSRLVEDIREYLRPQTRNFYRDRGVPYRRGYLLHGPPGTGKSSLSLALASEFNLDVYILEIPSLRSDIELKALFTQLPQRCIVLLEDVDAIGLQRRRALSNSDLENKSDSEDEHSDSVEKRSGCSLSGLLNLLDGVASPEGRILVITTNAIEKLDTALFRDGRVDIKVYLGNMDKESARLMFKTMYQLQSETLPSVQIDNSTKQQSCYRRQRKPRLLVDRTPVGTGLDGGEGLVGMVNGGVHGACTVVNCYAIPDIVGSRIGSVPSTTHSELAALVATLQFPSLLSVPDTPSTSTAVATSSADCGKKNACWGNLCAIQGPISRQSIVIKSREVPGQAVAKANSLEDVTLKEGPGSKDSKRALRSMRDQRTRSCKIRYTYKSRTIKNVDLVHNRQDLNI
ncbi:mitochondrial chaperone bcs1 [Pyricularia oryzae Y34]|uniref:Mitochondrial chaperone bcs1 n=1 Tax=Pyricularia oryzae (strain Y34) TaxID=1143189 RepID=A0AA97NM13_PYRO3|nr:mitochondrial chaperone bcs1 [Pyricularia oryzae Y34]